MNRLACKTSLGLISSSNCSLKNASSCLLISVRNMAGERGSGAGKGGGSGGSIRDAGGAMGKKEAAQEDQYFRQQSAQQLSKLKSALDSQIASHQKLIKEHQEAIDQAKQAINDLESKK